MKYKYMLGIDEAGRGSLAGRVFVGAVLLPIDFRFKNAPDFAPKDSKKLSDKKRREWLNWMKENDIQFFYSASSNKVIDRLNINIATALAVRMAIKGIGVSMGVINKIKLLSDKGMTITNDIFDMFEYEKILHGDSVVPIISLASIVAKVMRDNEMIKLSKKYPEYNFSQHKGYGTKKHFEAIKKYGICEIHRLTFLKRCNTISFSLKS